MKTAQVLLISLVSVALFWILTDLRVINFLSPFPAWTAHVLTFFVYFTFLLPFALTLSHLPNLLLKKEFSEEESDK